MINIILNINKHVLYGPKIHINTRYFNKWLIIAFNGIDEKRVEKVGPDRACAEWLLKNGASVKWKGSKDFLENYNLLPDEKEKFYLQLVDATDSSIHHIGFPHFSGCKHIEEIKLVRCTYIENAALPLLLLVKDTLKNLEVVECKNITDEALLQLKSLTNLTNLKLGGFPYVENKTKIMNELIAALPKCTITYIDEQERK